MSYVQEGLFAHWQPAGSKPSGGRNEDEEYGAPEPVAERRPASPVVSYRDGMVVVEDLQVSTAASLDELVWDERVEAYTAPAYCYGRVADGLQAAGARFDDLIASAIERLDPGPQTPELRPYQREALWAWQTAGKKGIVALPTGAGKTRVAMAAAASCSVATLVLVPTRVLLSQWHESFRHVYDGVVGRVGDGMREVGPITICTFESGYRHLQRFGHRFGLVVVDEVHNFASGLKSESLEMAVAPFRMGLSATPPSDPESAGRLCRLVGPVVFGMAVTDLAGSYLSDYETVVLPVDLSPDEHLHYHKHQTHFLGYFRRFKAINPAGGWPDFVSWARSEPGGLGALSSWHASRRVLSLPSRKKMLIEELLGRHVDRRILIFTRDNAAAYELSRAHLIPALTCDIRRKEREEVLARFSRGDVRAIVSSRVLNEGLDVPEADVAVIVGGAMGDREYVQRVGRVLRSRPQKKALVYELVVRETFEARHARRHGRSLSRSAVSATPSRPKIAGGGR